MHPSINSYKTALAHLLFLGGLSIFLSCNNKVGSNSKRNQSITANRGGPNSSITVDKFMGVNAFVDDPIDRMMAVGFVREYHLWLWDEGNGDTQYKGYPHREIRLAPGSPGWDFDQFYDTIKKSDMEISPCIQSSVPWLHKEQLFPTNTKPTDRPEIPSDDPMSYYARASYLFQYAGRYGRRSVAKRSLRFATDQPLSSGLNLIHYIEDWNEPDRYWEGTASEFSPDELAAMLSADYDGHEKSMVDPHHNKPVFGVKNADPTMKFVMGGLSTINIPYIDHMNQWFKKHRKDQKFAADVLNVHTYAWKNGKDWQGGGPAISPEQAKFKEQAEELVNYRDKYLPQMEVWISEFGWDTHPGSVLSPPEIGNFDIQEVQAQWILRAFLAFQAAGVDRAQLYMLRDVDSDDPMYFATAGLVSEKGEWLPKKAWYYVYTMKNILKNMTYIGEEKSTDPKILVYKFINRENNQGAYAIWAKTSENYHTTYELAIDTKAAEAVNIEPIVGETAGLKKQMQLKNSTVSLHVTEKPSFVLVDHMNK